MKLIRALALLFCLVSGAASATVVYKWETLTPMIVGDKTFIPGQIEFTTASWRSGHATSYPTCDYWTCARDATDLVRFKMMGFDANGRAALDDWRIDVTFDGEAMSGSIYYNSQMGERTIWMGGGETWTVSASGAVGLGCYSTPYCTGMTGRWSLVSIAEDAVVPEPNGPALFALALAGMAGGLRLSRRRQCGRR